MEAGGLGEIGGKVDWRQREIVAPQRGVKAGGVGGRRGWRQGVM